MTDIEFAAHLQGIGVGLGWAMFLLVGLPQDVAVYAIATGGIAALLAGYAVDRRARRRRWEADDV